MDRAGGQYPRTGVARQYGRTWPGHTGPAKGGRNLRLTVNPWRSVERRLTRMNIASTSFSTRIRTWLLMAGLTGLLLVIGAAIGGGALYLFVLLAVGMNLAGYWFSDRLALKASRARP